VPLSILETPLPDHPPHPTVRETGADVRGRFRYQDQVAAIYALRMLEQGAPYRAMYLEWHDDFLLEKQDGKLVPVQVKTRDEQLDEVALRDKLFHGVLKGFMDKDQALGTLVSGFIFASERSVNSGLVSATRGLLTNPLHSPRGDWKTVWDFLRQAYPTENRESLGRRVATVMNRIEVDRGLPRRADGMSRIVHTLANIFPLLTSRSHGDLSELARVLVNEIARRSEERYDLVARVRRGATDAAVLDAIAPTRRLDASEVRRILGVPLVGTRSVRRDRAKNDLITLLNAVSEHRRRDLAADIELPMDVATPLSEALADCLLAAPLRQVLRAVGSLDEQGPKIGEAVCVARYLGDTDAARANALLNADSASCLGAAALGRFEHRSGEGYIRATRLSLPPWRWVHMDESEAECSERTLSETIESSLRRALNSYGRTVPLAQALQGLRLMDTRVVLLVAGHHMREVVRRVLALLPCDARILCVEHPDVEAQWGELIELPAPDPEAERCFASCAL
jgi:hypothetical protein